MKKLKSIYIYIYHGRDQQNQIMHISKIYKLIVRNP